MRNFFLTLFAVCFFALAIAKVNVFAEKTKKFEVLIQGSNFLIMIDGKPKQSGFYVTRFIEAENPEEAEEQVVKLLRADESLTRLILNKPDHSPVLNVVKIEEVKTSEGKKSTDSGYAFYPEKSSEK